MAQCLIRWPAIKLLADSAIKSNTPQEVLGNDNIQNLAPSRRAWVQAFGKAGSAALGQEADKMQPGGKKRQPGGNLELKAGAARGLYAGPVGGRGR